MAIVIFLVILTVLVVVHEAGHFLLAKLFNVKVEEFGFGFPPKVWGKKIGETVYSINALPIGGFVKLFGEDEAGGGRVSFKSQSFKNKQRAFFARPWWQKFIIVFAGVLMNFILAWVILSFLFALVGATIIKDGILVESVMQNSPAQKAGLKHGDVILKIEKTKLISTNQLVEETKKHLGQNVSLEVMSQGKLETLKIIPRKEYPKNQGPLGVVIGQNVEHKKYPWYEAPLAGFKDSVNRINLIVFGLYSVVSQLFSTGTVPQGAVAGPVAIAQLTGFFCSDTVSCFEFASFLSLNLAVLNVLPIPALDGGRLFFILFEAITRRKVHPKFESYVHIVGMIFLLGLMLLVTIYDINRVLSGQSLIPK